MTSRSPLLIAAAVSGELAFINAHLSGAKTVTIGQSTVHFGHIHGQDIATLVTGAGAINMAGALGSVFSRLAPRALIVSGCGGGYEGSGVSPGDLVLATEEIHGQLGVEDSIKPGVVHPLSFLKNSIELNQSLVQEAYNALLENSHGDGFVLFKGRFITVSTVTSLAETASRYWSRYGALVENMEGFAAAVICAHYHVPLLELRAISNMAGEADRNTWQLDFAFERAQEGVLKILEKGFTR
jgi:futalosine hydrolase